MGSNEKTESVLPGRAWSFPFETHAGWGTAIRLFLELASAIVVVN